MSLEVRDLVVRFGGVSALAGVSFAVRPGGVTSLIGPMRGQDHRLQT